MFLSILVFISVAVLAFSNYYTSSNSASPETNGSIGINNVDDSENNLERLDYTHGVDVASLLRNQSYYENYTQCICTEKPESITYIGKVASVQVFSAGTCDDYYEKMLLTFASGNCIIIYRCPKNIQIGSVNVISADDKDFFTNPKVKIPKLEA